jgi:hypothetical protein
VQRGGGRSVEGQRASDGAALAESMARI